MIRWVRQEDANGCALAVLAMLTGETYDAVKAEVATYAEYAGHDGDWGKHGTTHYTLDRFLIPRGFYMQRVFVAWHQRRVDDVNDPADPVRHELLPGAVWPPVPWAPLHFASVQQPSRHSHFVAMDADGRVFDPLREGVYSLADWPEVQNVVGLVKP